VRKRILFFGAAIVVIAVSLATVHAANETLPAAGQVAPTFTLPSQDGSQISLSSFRSKWVVLYFYPKDMTSGCTIEAHNFQRDQAKFDAVNTVILGVSVDTPDSHKEFCTKEGLTFRLLADPEHKVVDAYGSLGHFGTWTIANRNTFLIDPQGTIAKVWTKVDPSVHSTEVLAAIAAAQQSVKPSNPAAPPAATKEQP
jgi:thioredoxin-dependent peroxiredoxin